MGRLFTIILCIVFWGNSNSLSGELKYQPAPVDNPLKGLVPYLTADSVDRFPHSLEFQYFSLKELMPARDQFDWSKVEAALEKSRSRGCQMVLRVFLEFPGKKESSIPQFLIDEGVKVTEWKMETADGGICRTPDYSDPKLRSALLAFIEAFGKKYDKDPRVGFLTAGLLGSWGEWHTWPRDNLMASKEVQIEVLSAFEKAFTEVPVLLRYPANEKTWALASNINRPFGFHDDSFSWATLDTGKKEDDWFFLPALKAAGGLEKWRTEPIGGEIRPELWTTMFTAKSHPKDQGFAECVKQSHVTWLMDSGMFEKRFPMSDERKSAAIREVQRMGYELTVTNWKIEGEEMSISLENRGVAPFYRNWPVELALFDGQNEIGKRTVPTIQLSEILPGSVYTRSISIAEFPDGEKGIWKLRIPNPMEGGKPLRFANETQGKEWLVLGAQK